MHFLFQKKKPNHTSLLSLELGIKCRNPEPNNLD